MHKGGLVRCCHVLYTCIRLGETQWLPTRIIQTVEPEQTQQDSFRRHCKTVQTDLPLQQDVALNFSARSAKISSKVSSSSDVCLYNQYQCFCKFIKMVLYVCGQVDDIVLSRHFDIAEGAEGTPLEGYSKNWKR